MKNLLVVIFIALVVWHLCGHIAQLIWGREFVGNHREIFRFFGVVWMQTWRGYDLFWVIYVLLELVLGLAAIWKK